MSEPQDKWAKYHLRCQNCTTVRFPHKALGLCSRCYRLTQRLKEIEGWDLQNPKSLKGYTTLVALWRPDTLERVRSWRRNKIKTHLEFLRTREEQLAGYIDGLDLENAFSHVAKLAGTREQFFHGLATSFDWDFTPEQRKTLFRLLNSIEEELPWRYHLYGNGYDESA